jgi:hypothetical protein
LTAGGDYEGDMRHEPLSDAEIDALIEGRRIPGGHEALAEALGALRSVARHPAPPPAAELALLFREGLATDKGESPVTATSNVPGPATRAAGLPKWKKGKRMAIEILAGVAAKLGALGATAKGALAVTAASATITAAGAGGVLPAGLHDAVDAVIPFNVGQLNGAAAEDVEGTETEDVDGTEETEGTEDSNAEGAPEEPGAAGQQGLDRASENETAAEQVPTTLGPGTGEEMRERNSRQPEQPATSGDAAQRPEQPATSGDAAQRPEQPATSGDAAQRPEQPAASGDAARESAPAGGSETQPTAPSEQAPAQQPEQPSTGQPEERPDASRR